MGWLSDVRKAWSNLISLDSMVDRVALERATEQARQRDYYYGLHKRQVGKAKGGADDNLIVNFAALVVDRGISMLLGQGLAFDMAGEPQESEGEDGSTIRVDPPNQQYIDAVWDANKRDILLHKVAQFGGMHGTCYIKIEPDGIEQGDGPLPRLIPIDPLYVSVETHPEDIDHILRYIIRFNMEGPDGKTRARKEVIEQEWAAADEDGEPTIEPGEMAGFVLQGWVIRNYMADTASGGKWELISEEQWEYPFPPMLHWQNLPMAGSVYGRPDLSEDVIAVNDRINFTISNISKILRYHAHPKTWGRGTALGNQVEWGADEMVMVQGENGMLANLEMQSDLQSSLGFAHLLRQALFDISRTVDISSMQDKIGALTNFGLRVLFYDALAKLNTKRELYGEALMEINRRVLILVGQEQAAREGGVVVWPEALPVEQQAQIAAIGSDIALGLLSKQTAAGMRGYDWEKEQGRLKQEQEREDSVGARLLRAFETGQDRIE